MRRYVAPPIWNVTAVTNACHFLKSPHGECESETVCVCTCVYVCLCLKESQRISKQGTASQNIAVHHKRASQPSLLF